MRGVTTRQLELLRHVAAGGPDGPLDFDQLLERLSWKPTKQAAQFSIRALMGREFLEKLPTLQNRRGRLRVCYGLTQEGKILLDPRLTPVLETKASPPGVPGRRPRLADVEPEEVSYDLLKEGGEIHSGADLEALLSALEG